MIETVLCWIVSVAGDSSIFASALCHIAERLSASDFNLNQIESIRPKTLQHTKRFDPVLCLAAPLAYSGRVKFQLALRVEIVAQKKRGLKMYKFV